MPIALPLSHETNVTTPKLRKRKRPLFAVQNINSVNLASDSDASDNDSFISTSNDSSDEMIDNNHNSSVVSRKRPSSTKAATFFLKKV